MRTTKADEKWSRAVKERDGYTCRRVFVAENHAPETARRGLHAHHIFTRSRKPTKFDVDNGITLCMACHLWAHANPIEFLGWVKDEMGEDAYTDLYRRSIKTKASA